MIEVLLMPYLAGAAYFLLSALQRVELYNIDLEVSRSRETKALRNQCIKRSRKDILESLVWPVKVFRLLKAGFSVLRSSK